VSRVSAPVRRDECATKVTVMATFSPIVLEAHNPGPLTGRGNKTYLVCANGDAALIDAGVGEARHLAALARALDEHRARLEYVLVTHAHADHASGAGAIASTHDAAFAKYPRLQDDRGYGVAWRPLADGQTVRVGDVELAVVHTPGHAPDHVVFWHDPSRTAFTGDLVIEGSSVMLDASHGGSLQQYLASLERVRALNPRTLLPAHGPEVVNPAALLTQYIEHRRVRERQVIAALDVGHATVQAIAESIYDGLDPVLMPAARENVRAHLDKLKAEGRAFEDHGRWRP
jgi:glyoxylase-like metal-dependent hydrolase (beta-lactamase superfamily II)